MKQILETGKVSRLVLDSGIGGFTGEAHLLENSGEKYMLRICRSKKRADFYEDVYNQLEQGGFLPKLIDRYENNLLFEYIGGRDCIGGDCFDIARKMGEIYAAVSKISKKPDSELSVDERLEKSVTYLTKHGDISLDYAESLRNRYRELRVNVNPRISIDLTDPMPSNFRISKGQLYLVDIDAIGFSLRGKGIAKLFLKWFKKDSAREMFFQGYQELLTPKYLQIAYLFYLVKNINFKSKLKMNYTKNLEMLDLFLERELK